MLDNIEGAELVSVAQSLRKKWQGKRKFLLETSGNITETNLQERAINGNTLSQFCLAFLTFVF
jgi:nicotinate-nucleotide pyrophosphorylase (carboxylating)